MSTGNNFPIWLYTLSAASLCAAFVCAVIIAGDEIRRPQKMWIMNLVWPLTTLFGSNIWLGIYFAWGRAGAREENPPFAILVLKGTSHCGAGCTVGDIVAEWSVFAFPGSAAWFGWHTLFAEQTFAVWVLDFILAFLFGVAFQYFSIAPMRHLSLVQDFAAALKAYMPICQAAIEPVSADSWPSFSSMATGARTDT